MKASDVLRKAGDVLRERGHCKGLLTDFTGRVCLVGAVNMASSGYADKWIYCDAVNDARGAVSALFDESSYGLLLNTVDWNNAPERTAEEVQGALDAAYVLALQVEGVEPEDVLS